MTVTLEIVGLDRAPEVQAVLESSPGYYRRVDGTDVLPHFARREMTEMPPPEKCQPFTQKFFGLLSAGDQPIGVVDMLRDYPVRGIAYLGLLLLAEDRHGQGLGRASYRAVEDFVTEEWQVSAIRLGVAQPNGAAEGFWSRMGFRRNGHTYAHRVENGDVPVFEMEKTLG